MEASELFEMEERRDLSGKDRVRCNWGKEKHHFQCTCGGCACHSWENGHYGTADHMMCPGGHDLCEFYEDEEKMTRYKKKSVRGFQREESYYR